ncbi:MAG: dihydroorotase [Candidatus Omnitrophota bacterium]|nr:MAG: dihydroorotase [Candidatus Omnitrophota bacterium]
MKILIKNGRVVDPANNLDKVCDILVDNGKIARVAAKIDCAAESVIDAKDKIVMPGIIDMHVHLREPGREDKETVLTATEAALAGGITSVLAMPNTTPAIDCAENVKLLKSIIKKDARNFVFIAGAITRARQGEEVTDTAKLKKEGVLALTDDGSSVDKDEVFLEALREAKKSKLLIICHSEDKTLSADGAVNLGITSTRMGLRGISRESEYKRVERDIALAREASCPVHIAHISCKESVEIIRRARKKGIKVTCETAPHYFALNEEAVLGFDTNMKMNPPLRAQEDVQAIKQGLADGTIDAIASDHAPHTENEKDIEFERAQFGVIGLETEGAVAITELVDKGILDWKGLVRKLSVNPAKILGINKGSLGKGSDADIVIISPQKKWTVQRDKFLSKSKNSPFIGRTLKGVVEYTICGGKVAFSR